MDSLQAFLDAFPGSETGSSQGRWRYDATGSTSSNSTGPGSNNSLAFVHTEASSGGLVTLMRSNGLAQFDTVPSGSGRTLRLRLALQGTTVMRGMAVETSVDGVTWTEQAFLRAWVFSNSRTVGDTFDNRDGEELTCVADGGWVDWTVTIPNSATRVRLAPRYDDTNLQQDQALREFEWS